MNWIGEGRFTCTEYVIRPLDTMDCDVVLPVYPTQDSRLAIDSALYEYLF